MINLVRPIQLVEYSSKIISLILTVIALTAHEAASAKADTPLNISITYPIGSVHDTMPGEAHLIEHLKFKTNSAHGSGIYENIPGATFNAFTYNYKTTYLFQAGFDALPAILEEFRNISLPLDITQADFEREKQIVKQEILQRTKSNPDMKYYQRLGQQLYAGTSLAHGPVGQVQSIDALTLDKVRRWNRKTYEKTGALVFISGELDKNDVLQMARKILPKSRFSILVINTANPPKKPDLSLVDKPALLDDTGIKISPQKPFAIKARSDRISNTNFTWKRIYRAGKNWRNQLAARNLLLKAISSRLPEGLHDRIGEENRIVKNWSISISWPAHGYWQTSFSATLAEGTDVETVKKAINTYLDELATTGISKKSFARLLKRSIRSEKRKWQNPDVAASSFFDDMATYGYRFAWSWPRQLAALNPDDITNFLQGFKKPLREATLILEPKEPANE